MIFANICVSEVQVYPKTGMVEIVKDDLRSRAAFGRKETKSLV